MPKVSELISGQVRRAVEDSIAEHRSGRKQVFVPLQFKAEAENDGRIWFDGMANVSSVDRTGDVIEPSAFRKSLKLFLKFNPQMFYMHDWYVSIGKFTEGEVRDNGLWVRGYVAPAVDDEGAPLEGRYGEFLRMIRGQVKRGELRTLSIGFRPLDRKTGKATDPVTGKERDVSVITNLELLEVSIVTIPASRESVMQVRSYLAEQHGEEVADSLVSEFEDQADGLEDAIKTILSNPEQGRTLLDQLSKALEGDIDTKTDKPKTGQSNLKLVTLEEIEATRYKLVSLDPDMGGIGNER